MKVWDRGAGGGTGAMKTVTWYFTSTGDPPAVQKRSLDLPGTRERDTPGER